ncbi:collagen alpha-1(VII) chain-like [Moschus berezovskii]|uniref:collagen alpha-1(VII) chain-like n=1 Tax=Moschus berezovskii TaxID=68408 RepID=UPI0024446534|nr:collagen alpha-1(VII) chain-like [Moschus berezovskii]
MLEEMISFGKRTVDKRNVSTVNKVVLGKVSKCIRALTSTSRAPNLWNLRPDDLRWSLCNNNRNEVHKNAAHWDYPQTTLPKSGENRLPRNRSLVPKRLRTAIWRTGQQHRHLFSCLSLLFFSPPPPSTRQALLALLRHKLGVSSTRSRACASPAPPGTQLLQAAPPTPIPPRPPSGVAESELSLRFPRLGTYGDGGTDAALRSPPAAGLPGPARAQQAAPRNSGLKSWPRRPGTAPGRDGQASPARPPRSRARAPIPGSQPAVPAGLPRRRRGCPRLCAFLAALLGCPGAPTSLPGVGELRLAEKRPSFQSGARRPELRERGEGEERRGEGDTAWAGARDFQSPPEVPSSRRRRPAGRGQKERPGRGGRSWRSARGVPGCPAPALTSEKVRSTGRRTIPSSPRLPVGAAPAPLSTPCPGQPDERSASAPPPPRAPPPEAPPPARPEVAGAVAKPQQRSAELATARGAPAGPAPGPTKLPAEGRRESEAGESRARHASGVLGREEVGYAFPASLRHLDQLLGTGDKREEPASTWPPRPQPTELPAPRAGASTLLGLLLPANPVSPRQGRQ